MKSLVIVAMKVLIGLFSRIFPRNDNTWVFGTSGGDVFWENPKYFFLYMNHEKSGSDVRPIWISGSDEMVENLKENGYEAYHRNSLKGLWFSLRAGRSFCSHNIEDINDYGLAVGSKIVHLHHGSPLKRISWDVPMNNSNPFVIAGKIIYQALYYSYDIGITTSDYLTNIYLSAEFLKPGRFEATGQPRNDLFFRDVKDWEIGADEDAVKKMSSLDRTKVMYLPTWRDDDKYSFEDIIELERMNKWARRNDSVVIFKLHPASNINEDAVKEFDNLWLMQQSVDLQPLLKETDILISDYSSVHNDFLLLDRPIVFYPFDKERYKKYRGFVRDYDYFTPGPKAYNFDELLECLDEVIEEDNYKDERKEIREKYFDDIDGNSSERVWKMLRED